MTQTSHLKSAQITALDATPYGDLQSAGLGAPGRLNVVSGTVTPVAADATGSTYQMVRVPSFASIKQVLLSSQAQGAGKVDISVYYSDSTVDGTPPADQGLVVPTTGASFFSGDIDISAAVAQSDETFGNAANAGSYNQSLINKRLWDALGLTSDPGGFFDIVLVVHTTAITTGGGFVSLQVAWVE